MKLSYNLLSLCVLLSQVEAHDRDRGEWGQLTYTLSSVSDTLKQSPYKQQPQQSRKRYDTSTGSSSSEFSYSNRKLGSKNVNTSSHRKPNYYRQHRSKAATSDLSYLRKYATNSSVSAPFSKQGRLSSRSFVFANPATAILPPPVSQSERWRKVSPAFTIDKHTGTILVHRVSGSRWEW